MKGLALVGCSFLFSLTVFAEVPGGLTVCVGSDAAEQVSKDWKLPGRIFQCLETDEAKVSNLRKQIRDAGVYGKASARAFDGENLPFVDGTINLLVLDAESKVPAAEIKRVLTPNGAVVVDGKRGVKPIPAGLDGWSHFHYDATGTMVGGDTVVGPPRRIQWMGGPKWLRNHDFMSSMSAMVSSGGRIFYILDEGLRNHIFLPSRWVLVARDAYNGTILWKQEMKDWQPNNWPLKSGPGDLPRRLVAVGDTVYVTKGLFEPVVALDAATGTLKKIYQGTQTTVEIIRSGDTLFLLTDPEMQPVGFRVENTSYGEIKRANAGWEWSVESPQRVIMAVDDASGKVRWQHKTKAAPLTLTVNAGQVFFHNGESLIALDRKTGKEQWTSDPTPVKSVPTGGSLRVAYSDGVTVFADVTKLTAFEAKSGKTLWTEKLQKTSHHCPEDLFIIDGQIWSPNTGKPQQNGTHYKVIDLHTGNVNKDFVAENIKGFPMHPRCYPSRATKRFVMTNGMGTEFYEVGGTTVDVNNTVRGSCLYGVMPANGLLYKPADSCACYYQSKLEFFCGLAPESKAELPKVASRLKKGPAFGTIGNNKSAISTADWPMYRGNPARSAASSSPVPAKLKEAWKVALGSKLTQPVVAGNRMFVASIDGHTVYALNVDDGKILWPFPADGRIDSSPTLYKDMVLFGSADGRAYCLRAADGALAWRYLIAPNDRQIVSLMQPESVWPASGSLMVYNDIVYCLAGRNMFFDGGLRLALLDPATGREISTKMMDQNDPATGENLQTLIEAKYMPVANPDLFSCNGKNLFLQTQKFDLKGNRINLAPIQPGKETPDMADDDHLFCQTGFLDSVWFHRSFWIYGNNCGEGWGAYTKPRNTNPAGRIMAFDETQAYAFRSDPLGNMLHPRTSYTLYAAAKKPAQSEPVEDPAADTGKKKKKKKTRKKKGGSIQQKWQIESPRILVNAMAIGGKTLFVAGPPDLADETKMMGFLPGAEDDANRQLRLQEEAWNGKHGGILWAVSTETGEKLGELNLEIYPVFDGLIAANGKLFMSMKDGTVRCFK
ncbi:MAG: PQQ-binding-like beta-propeller repeat protein [Kiritimatiellales bacterium]|nr:PQQ-binding-like beta-propeller repeat protein [Kiritimatiellales bacterium]